MDKVKEIKTTQEIVKEVLESDIEARNSDDYLIYAVCKRINPVCMGLSFETIRRTGQRVRAKYPELAGNSIVETHRGLNEGIFRDYARGAL
jgi:hypothetical protein